MKKGNDLKYYCKWSLIWVKSFLLTFVVVAALPAVVVSNRIGLSNFSWNLRQVDVLPSNFVVG